MYAGAVPARAPLNVPPSVGDRYAPVALSAPVDSIARWSASMKETPAPGWPTGWIRSCPTSRLSAGTPSSAAAPATIFPRSSSAASRAALPIMNVTRLEYDPRSIGLTSESTRWTCTRSRSTPSTSATIAASRVFDPWPMSACIECTAIPPSMSTFRCTVDWGIFGVKWIGLFDPEM